MWAKWFLRLREIFFYKTDILHFSRKQRKIFLQICTSRKVLDMLKIEKLKKTPAFRFICNYINKNIFVNILNKKQKR